MKAQTRQAAQYRNIDSANKRIYQLLGVCDWYDDELTAAKKVINAARLCQLASNDTELTAYLFRLYDAVADYDSRGKVTP